MRLDFPRHADPAHRIAVEESRRIALERMAAKQQPADYSNARVAALEERVARLEHLGDILGDDAEHLVEGLGSVLPEFVHQETVGLKARVATLEAELEALKAKQIVFRGTHQAGAMYQANDLCIRQGGLWLCRKDTVSPPGTDPDSWTLAVKKGAVSERGGPASG